jgi:hypothetical protein
MSTRPESERSDWTDRDLLTLSEALPRLELAIAELTSELDAADPGARDELRRRLAALQAARDDLRERAARR